MRRAPAPSRYGDHVNLGDLAFIFGTSLGVGFSGAVTPGPLFTFTVAEAAHRGARAGPLIVLGHAILELALLIALGLGLSRVLSNGAVVAAVSLVGGVALVAFGAAMGHSTRTARLSLHGSARGSTFRLHPVVAGVVASASNPFWTVWWATIGLAYLTRASAYGLAGTATFYAGHILSDLTWFGGVALLVATGRRFLRDPAYRVLIGVCGLFLIGLGVYFIVDGAKRFMV